jgi:hypothetical protein
MNSDAIYLNSIDEINTQPSETPQSIPINNSKIQKIGNFRLGKTIGVGSFGKVKSMARLY